MRSKLEERRESLSLQGKISSQADRVFCCSPVLEKNSHVQYLAKNLFKLPAPFVSLDASRPWMLYWILHSFDLLGVALDQATKDRAIATILSCQHPSGGFGGNVSHLPHLLTTYASICSLAMLGAGWESIDRTAIYSFFMRMKRQDGGFAVCQGGEVDVRGVYCLLATATLLNLLTPELVEKTADFVASCQTYEGGFSASPSSISHTFFSPFTTPVQPLIPSYPIPTPLGEAHGGYTSCAVLSLHLLRPLATPTKPVNEKALLRWSVMMQASAVDGGGFKGRSNKLVDGCYGWWVGGSFTVLEEMVKKARGEEEKGRDEGALYDRAALQEFVLTLAQHPKGGLRDKPPKNADFYHTVNNLAGLSSSQHRLILSPDRCTGLAKAWRPSSTEGGKSGSGLSDEKQRDVFVQALGWKELESQFLSLGGEGNRVNTTHPAINILLLRAEPMMRRFYNQEKDFGVKAE
ncbi:terpenoid cyclases/protein prenyltransferase alpha-alpha toroid [Mrakia frigida]|uniref:protein farnesyltransferase subunit beta n=1 Tax=Mrakia frigida TaxID=29902 RepID=UPI003FCC1258